MATTLTHPFVLRLTSEEESAINQAHQLLTKRPPAGIRGRVAKADAARMALDRGLPLLIQELQEPDSLPHDEVWLDGALQASADLLPPFDWGSMDPTQDGDPILAVRGRGAYVVR